MKMSHIERSTQTLLFQTNLVQKYYKATRKKTTKAKEREGNNEKKQERARKASA